MFMRPKTAMAARWRQIEPSLLKLSGCTVLEQAKTEKLSDFSSTATEVTHLEPGI